MSALTASPLSDPAFAAESAGARRMVLHRHPAMLAIQAEPRRYRAITAQAARLGVPFKTMFRWYYAWRKAGGDWRKLVDRAKFPAPAEAGTPALFQSFCVSLYESFQRANSGRRAYAALMARLAAWERDPLNPELAIPGYERPPRRNAVKGHPEGWSYQNFMNILKKRCNVFERTLRRQGPKAASVYLPSVRTTRTGLAFGQVLYFDDDQHDTAVNLAGVNNTRTLRPLCFSALEALSASRFAMGLKPQMELEGGKTRALDQGDFFWFVMHVLLNFGYNAKDGTTLVWEHGTANPDKTGKFDELLHQATGGLVTVDKSGRFGKPEFKEMLFEGRPAGNFRFKSPIESFFNLVRNWSALLPGATGRNRDLAPEENYGIEKYNNQLSKLVDKLTPEQFLRLRRPVLEWEDYCAWARVIDDLIDLRRDHDLEGWDKLGFRGQRYRLSTDSNLWLSEKEYQLIPAGQRAALDHVVSQPGYFESFKLSPREVRLGHEHTLTKLSPALVPALAPERLWRPVTLSESLEFTVHDSWIEPEPMFFSCRARTAQGYEVVLERGKTYLALLNLFDPDMLWVAETDGSRKGAFIGTARRVRPNCKLDYAGILRQVGEVAHLRAVEAAEVHARMRDTAAGRVAMYRHNREVIAGTTPADRAAAREEQSLARRAQAAQAAANQQNQKQNESEKVYANDEY